MSSSGFVIGVAATAAAGYWLLHHQKGSNPLAGLSQPGSNPLAELSGVVANLGSSLNNSAAPTTTAAAPAVAQRPDEVANAPTCPTMADAINWSHNIGLPTWTGVYFLAEHGYLPQSMDQFKGWVKSSGYNNYPDDPSRGWYHNAREGGFGPPTDNRCGITCTPGVDPC